MIGEHKKIKTKSIDISEWKDPIDEKNVEQLISSINDNGMFHSIIVKKDMSLVAGRHRLEAHLRSNWDEIDAWIVPKNLTPDEILEIHLHENLRRRNLAWHEQVEDEKKLHELRQRQMGKAQTGRGKSGWSLRDTAQEVGRAVGMLSEDLQLAEALSRDPSLKNVGDRNTAFKLMKEETKRMEQRLVSAVSVTGSAINTILCGDSSEILKSLEADTFDAVITDPPWLEYKDEKLTSDKNTILVFKELYRVMRTNSFLYAVVSTDDFFMYRNELPKFGFKVQTFPLLWVKQNMFSHGLRSWEYSRDFEPILLAVKGTPALTEHRQMSSVFTYPVIPPMKLVHPNEKPIALIENIIKQCTFENATILDPFAGSGVVLEAARKMGRQFLGIERNFPFYAQIGKRLGMNVYAKET